MRYLGIDYGSKRIGLALSDESHDFSYPLQVLDNSKAVVNEIVEICVKNNIGEIIVGESLNFSQKPNEIMKEIIPFVKNLEEKLKIPVHMHPEFLTSAEAEQIQGKNEMHDASAAALILKSYLDLKNNSSKII